jgi:hypothetical protein
MKIKLKWHKAIMKQDLYKFEQGKKVLVTEFAYKHKSVGKTWFVFDGLQSYQVAESYGGRNLCQLLATYEEFGDQKAVNLKFKPFFDVWASARSRKTLKST